MDSIKLSALLLLSMLFISSVTPILGCGYCSKHPPKKKAPKGPITLPPVTVPPVVKPPVTIPPVTVPPIVKPPVTLPPVTLPPVLNPPVTLPPVLNPPVTLPPVLNPPVTLPPVLNPPVTLPPVLNPPVTLPPVLNPPVTLPPVTLPPVTGGNPPSAKNPCPTPPAPTKQTCPIDTLKLGGCVNLLGGLVHIGIGHPAIDECCPVLKGLVDLEAAACLCTVIKAKVLNLKLIVPVALELLISCGKTPPPGYTCA